jgi:AcrR family transcriptional regulator
MSAGHIYNYFDSKEAIIMAFVDLESEHVARSCVSWAARTIRCNR